MAPFFFFLDPLLKHSKFSFTLFKYAAHRGARHPSNAWLLPLILLPVVLHQQSTVFLFVARVPLAPFDAVA